MSENKHTLINFIRSKMAFPVKVGLVNISTQIRYEQFIKTNFRIPTAQIPGISEGHSDQCELQTGMLGETPVILSNCSGSCMHRAFPGSDLFPLHILKELNINACIVTGDATIYSENESETDYLIIEDHISFFAPPTTINLRGSEIGSNPNKLAIYYDRSMVQLALEEFRGLQLKVIPGIYLGLPGNSLETPAEYRYIRSMNVDASGCGIIDRITIAAQDGVRCMAICIGSESNDRSAYRTMDSIKSLKPQKMDIFASAISSLIAQL